MDKTGEITRDTPDDYSNGEKRAGVDEKDHPARRAADVVKDETSKKAEDGSQPAAMQRVESFGISPLAAAARAAIQSHAIKDYIFDFFWRNTRKPLAGI